MIEALIGCATPGALVNSTSTPAERLIKTVVINSAGPSDMASSVVLLWPLPLQQTLGLPVILLLLPKCAHRIAPVMPDYGGRIEAQRPASFLQTPTDIDIIARHTELGIKPANGLNTGLANCHAPTPPPPPPPLPHPPL